MTSHYRNIIFDLDGTLTDSRTGIINSLKYATEKLDLEQKNPEELVRLIGIPLYDLFSNYYCLSKEDVDSAIFYFREYYQEKGICENMIYPGVTGLLENLSLKSDLFLATSKLERNARIVLEHFSIAQYFKDVFGIQTGYNSGKSELLQRLISKYDLCECNQTVMIGDRRMDINAARNCDIDSIAVTYGYGSLKELRSCKPTYIVGSVEELQDILVKVPANSN